MTAAADAVGGARPAAEPPEPARRLPALVFPPRLLLQAQGVRAAIFDVDGVLTDGRIYVSERGEEVKAFSTLDGHGLKLLMQAGIAPIVVTGRDSPAVRRRVADLGLPHAVYGAADKLAVAEPLLARLGLAWHEVAAMGDDWPDLPLLTRAGFACAPANAHAEVRASVHHVTAGRGGFGAARECCDLLLMAAGRYASLLDGQVTTLGPQPMNAPPPRPVTDAASAESDPTPHRIAARWTERALAAVVAWLPLLVMALLALGSWWLVQNTPLFDDARAPPPPRHEPDYTMTAFTVQRFTPAGTMRSQLDGDVLRHYPDTDTVEIDNPRIRSVADDGRVTLATAKRALANADASEVQLLGAARVTREATSKEEAIEFRGEFLHAFIDLERVRSHLPVVVTQGGTELRAAAVDYDNLSQVVNFTGRSQAVFAPPAQGGIKRR